MALPWGDKLSLWSCSAFQCVHAQLWSAHATGNQGLSMHLHPQHSKGLSSASIGSHVFCACVDASCMKAGTQEPIALDRRVLNTFSFSNMCTPTGGHVTTLRNTWFSEVCQSNSTTRTLQIYLDNMRWPWQDSHARPSPALLIIVWDSRYCNSCSCRHYTLNQSSIAITMTKSERLFTWFAHLTYMQCLPWWAVHTARVLLCKGCTTIQHGCVGLV